MNFLLTYGERVRCGRTLFYFLQKLLPNYNKARGNKKADAAGLQRRPFTFAVYAV